MIYTVACQYPGTYLGMKLFFLHSGIASNLLPSDLRMLPYTCHRILMKSRVIWNSSLPPTFHLGRSMNTWEKGVILKHRKIYGNVDLPNLLRQPNTCLIISCHIFLNCQQATSELRLRWAKVSSHLRVTMYRMLLGVYVFYRWCRRSILYITPEFVYLEAVFLVAVYIHCAPGNLQQQCQ